MLRMNEMRVSLCLWNILQCGFFNIRISTDFSFPSFCVCICATFLHNILKLHVIQLNGYSVKIIMYEKDPLGYFIANQMEWNVKLKFALKCCEDGEKTERKIRRQCDNTAKHKRSKIYWRKRSMRKWIRYALSKTKKRLRKRERENMSEFCENVRV